MTFAGIEDKIGNHWSKNFIDIPFLTKYFPYLAKNDFQEFDPNGTISVYEFSVSVASLFKDAGYNLSILSSNSDINREHMARFLGENLEKVGTLKDKSIDLPFKDINTMDNGSIELLRLLYSHGIIKGDSNSTFRPNGNLSQAEAIIILQRAKGVLSQLGSQIIPFKTLGVVQSFNNQEGIVTIQDGDNILVTITKQFPTPGYFMSVDKVVKESDGFKIYFDIQPPRPDSIQLQVITYKTITIEIEKDVLGEPPYNFILDGYNKIKYKEKI